MVEEAALTAAVPPDSFRMDKSKRKVTGQSLSAVKKAAPRNEK